MMSEPTLSELKSKRSELESKLIEVLLEGLAENGNLATSFFQYIFQRCTRLNMRWSPSVEIARRMLARGWPLKRSTADAAIRLARQYQKEFAAMRGLDEESDYLSARIDETPIVR